MSILYTISRQVAFKPILSRHRIFSGGEVDIQLEPEVSKRYRHLNLYILARISAPGDIITLLMTMNALREVESARRYHLILPYIPYARQDRVCADREAFGLRAFAGILNSMEFTTVTVLDAHSHVAPALIDNCRNVGVHQIIQTCLHLPEATKVQYTVVAPDAGASKKARKVAEVLGLQFAEVSKYRNSIGTVEVSGFVHKPNTSKLLVVDDICDGGATFIELAKKHTEYIWELWVTHGIFRNGLRPLLEAGYQRIYTTDSFQDAVSGQTGTNFMRYSVEALWKSIR